MFIILFFLLVLLFPQPSFAETKPPAIKVNRHFCENEELGIRYFCSPQWKRRDIDNAVLMIISSEPAVTLTITKIDSNIIFLEQLTKSLLDEKGLYADGFETGWKTFGDKKAIQVKAFSKQYSGRRLLDYYFMHNSELYAVLFSVHPKEQWDKYKFLIKQIRESFQFTDKLLTKG